MRFKFLFTLENEKFPIQYRKSIMSFIKMSLQEYNEETFDNLYHEKDPIMKPYTFSVFFKNPKFQEDSILLEDKKVELNFSIQDYNIAINIYNSFNHHIHNAFPLAQNFLTLQKISIIPEKQIKTDEIMVKFMSPLVVREHNNETKMAYQKGKTLYTASAYFKTACNGSESNRYNVPACKRRCGSCSGRFRYR